MTKQKFWMAWAVVWGIWCVFWLAYDLATGSPWAIVQVLCLIGLAYTWNYWRQQ